MERDVVCGMNVDPAKAAATSEYNGKTYYFCAKVCKTSSTPIQRDTRSNCNGSAGLKDVVDPVCGMTISPADSVGEVEHAGQTYSSATTAASSGDPTVRRQRAKCSRHRRR